MSREWKPGDVAVLNSVGNERICSYATDCPGIGGGSHPREPHWHVLDSGRFIRHSDARVIRPLVVIDPEDREQVEALTADYDAAVIRMNDDPDPRDVTPMQRATAMQAALRTLANPQPPKPDEPTGLGAVVEDANAERWIRIYDGAGKGTAWYCDNTKGSTQWVHYSQIATVKVLSDGVTA